ncbi:ATP-binding protein [Brevundimonas goettingensis]|uniref:histidine kinase n=1 Tax=Brevundimonas goettingensis TaxID=2774190 RepID=A0A975C7M3_9CAUL|nr:ATP-binding protein [Brevundimonas goettingensis]QTC93037.1 response regulator [Brevundimonas goettingensis]
MHRIINCLTTQHDWRFMLLAAVVCAGGIATAITLVGLGRSAAPKARRLYSTAGALVLALSIWATHFIAMVGYDPGFAVRYTPAATLFSLVIAVIGLSACVALNRGGVDRSRRIIGAVTGASSVAAMHFVGLAAVTFEGARFVYHPVIVALSVVVSLGFAVLTGLPAQSASRWRLPLVTGFALMSVCSLHFGSMAALDIVPDPSVVLTGGMGETGLLFWLATGVAVIIAMAAFVVGVASWSRNNALAQIREAVDAMPDGLAFFDADERLMVWNARYAEVNPEIAAALTVGMSFEKIIRIGVAAGRYTEAFGNEEAWIAERLAARKALSCTLEQHVEDDRWLRVQDRRTAAGGMVTVCNDITDLKRDSRALAEARDAAEAANRAKSEFLANMSHEIRTPLNGVIGLTQALARTEMTPDQTEMLELIQSSGHTLQTLLSDILDLARVESGRMEIASEPFDLARAVREAAQLYAAGAAEKGLSFFVDIEPEAAAWVRGDVVRVKQVLTNLVSNAVKFTDQGFVSLTACRGRRPDGSAMLRFTVEDTGVGFDAEARDRLFTRFEQADGTITRRFGGTGLGLAICRQLAEMMGGDLDCESEPGGGSAFILTLPLIEAQEPAALVEAQPDAEDFEPHRIRVLLADDHPTNRRVVELILAPAAVDMTSVEDGAQAVAAYRDGGYDLVLMDMQMPVMDGLTATREIRLHETVMGLNRTPIVMLTANALAEHVAAGQAAGADRHLAKPFNAAELLELVCDLGEQQRALAA